MAKKNFNAEELNEPTGPMNSAAKEDALVWAGAPPVKHLSKLQPKVKRQVLAKKKKAEKSSKKQDRKISNNLIRNIEK